MRKGEREMGFDRSSDGEQERRRTRCREDRPSRRSSLTEKMREDVVGFLLRMMEKTKQPKKEPTKRKKKRKKIEPFIC